MTAIALRPDPGTPAAPAATTAPGDTGWLDTATGWLDAIPGQAWAALLALLTIAAIVTFPLARHLAYKAGQRTAGRAETSNRDRALFLAAMLPAGFFWLAVLAGSFRGLAAFGRDTLRWNDGWEYLVPLTLDGVAISFGFLAFRAVTAKHSPDRANRVVWGAAMASAFINFVHEAGLDHGTIEGGFYLGLLSLLGMLIFHEFLDQFTQGTAYIQRRNPKFGARWLTWPGNTACAWVAWRNYPPKGLPTDASNAQRMWWGSVNHAVAHLATVRRAKRIARYAVDVEDGRLPAPWWSPFNPWMRVRQLVTVLTDETNALTETRVQLAAVTSDRDVAAAEAEKLTARLVDVTAATVDAERTAAEETQLRERISARLDATVERLTKVEERYVAAEREAGRLGQILSSADAERTRLRLSVDRAEKEAAAIRSELADATEAHRTEMSETVTRLRSEHAETVARIRAETSTVRLSDYRNGAGRKTRNGRRSAPPNQARMSDEEAVQALISAHPESDYPWKQTEVREITGAGFGRIPNLLSALAEYHRSVESMSGSGRVGGDTESGAAAGSEMPGGDRSADEEDSRVSASA